MTDRSPDITAAEIQSGMDRQQWAENLIQQLSGPHDGRNSWLLNYGRGHEAEELRRLRGLSFNEQSQAVNPPARASLQPASPTAGECSTCGGRKEVGGFDPHEVGYRTEPCPECTPVSDAVALAYRLDHPKFGIELSIHQPAGDWAGRGWTVTPLAALRSDAAGGVTSDPPRYDLNARRIRDTEGVGTVDEAATPTGTGGEPLTQREIDCLQERIKLQVEMIERRDEEIAILRSSRGGVAKPITAGPTEPDEGAPDEGAPDEGPPSARECSCGYRPRGSCPDCRPPDGAARANIPRCRCLACDVDGPHDPSCSVHNGISSDIGPCDCGASKAATQQQTDSVQLILAHWRDRFPRNGYAWPGRPEDWAIEAVKALGAAQPKREWVSPIKTVADLGNNLLTLDQKMDVYGAYHITSTEDRCRARGLSLSLEHVTNNRIKHDKAVPYSLVIWTAPAEGDGK